jgi:ABC-type branched-subunit amino acid transport system substrate-binding protein
MFRTRHGLGRAVAVASLIGLLAAGCGSDDGGDEESTDTTAAKSDFVEVSGVPGVTDEEIHFSAMGTSTAKNPLGECYLECFTDGVKAYFDYVNAGGGVYGRDLVLDDLLDDELGKSQQIALQIMAAKDSLATFLVPIISTAYQPFVDGKWPVYGYLTDHTAMAGKTNLFSTYSVSSFNVPKNDHPFIPKALGVKKLGVLGYGVASSQTCVKQIVDEFKGIYKDIASVVYSNDDLAFGLSNGVAPEVTAMKAAGVEAVFTCMESNGLKTFAQEMKRQGLGAPLVTYSVFENEFIETNASVLEGSIQGSRLRPDIASDSEGSKLFKEWIGKRKPAKINATTKQGWAAADLMVSGLKKVGGPFDQAKLIAATNAIEDWTANGLIAPVDIGRQHVGPTPTDSVTNGDDPLCFSYNQIKDGKLTFMGKATKDKPWVCWDMKDYEYREPVPTDVADL